MNPLTTWITQQVEKYGREACCEAFGCWPDDLDLALADDHTWRYRLGYERNAQARAYFKTLDAKSGAKKNGRPAASLTRNEAISLVGLVFDEGIYTLCQRLGVTEASLGKALCGRAVALGTVQQIRSALDNAA